MRARGQLVIAGNVLDDTGQPVAKESVALSLTTANTLPMSPVLFDTHDAIFESCGDPKQTVAKNKVDSTLILESDDLGAFCVRIALPIDRYTATLTTRSSSVYDSTTTELSLDLNRRTLSLAFDPRPRVLSVDESIKTVDALASFEDEGTTAPASGLVLSLQNEQGRELATEVTSASGRVHFAIAPRALGPPGRGELRLVFVEKEDTASGRIAVEVERHARVTLALSPGNEPPLGDPEEGAAITVNATAAGEQATSGSVEAYVGETLVGAAPVSGGHAEVIVTFPAPSNNASEARVRLRYVPDTPWYTTDKDLVVPLQIRAPRRGKRLPLFVAGLLVVAWLVLGRTRRPYGIRATSNTVSSVRKAEAAIEVVHLERDPTASFKGNVFDAHDNVAIQGARIAIERRGFEAVEVIASTLTNGVGAFELPCSTSRNGDVLAIEAPFHSALRQAVPARGELRVALVLRKRAIVDRLVVWARRQGRPYDTKAEPTPAHVRGAAGANAATARWADAVEHAAYGGGLVDASAEQVVDALMPSDARKNIKETAGDTLRETTSLPRDTLVDQETRATAEGPSSKKHDASPR
jgi:hypothetical protein